jgi:hypothetical protein
MEFGSIPLRYVWKSFQKNSLLEYTQFRQTLNICLKNFQETGSVGRKPESGRRKKRTAEVIEEARQAMGKPRALQFNIYHNNLVCLYVPVI